MFIPFDCHRATFVGYDVVLEVIFVLVECSCRPCAVIDVVRSSGMVVVLEWAADGKDVVCEPEVGEVHVGVVLDKSDSMVRFLPLSCCWFHDVLQE